MRRLVLAAVLLGALGCTGAQWVTVGKTAGVLRERDTVAVPLAQIRDLADSVYDSWARRQDWMIAKGCRPNSPVKFSAKECREIQQERIAGEMVYVKTKHVTASPEVEVDVEGVIRGIGAIVKTSAEVAK